MYYVLKDDLSLGYMSNFDIIFPKKTADCWLITVQKSREYEP